MNINPVNYNTNTGSFSISGKLDTNSSDNRNPKDTFQTTGKTPKSTDLRTAAEALFKKDIPQHWRYRGDFQFENPAAVSDDGKTIYLNNLISVSCVDGDGKEIWKEYHTYGTNFEAACSRDGSRVFVAEEKSIRGIPRDIGTTKSWSRELKASSSPAVGPDGTIYINAASGELHALNPETGEDLWTVKLENTSTRKPIIGNDGTIYTLTDTGVMNRFSPQGKPLKRLDLKIDGKNASFTVDKEGNLYISDAEKDNYLHALYPDGTEKWKYLAGNRSAPPPLPMGGQAWRNNRPVKNRPVPPPAIAPDGTVYLTNREENSLHAITPDGKNKWTFKFSEFKQFAPSPPSPVVGPDGRIFACDFNKTLCQLNPEDGTLLKKDTTSSFLGITPVVTPGGDAVLVATSGDVEFFRGPESFLREKEESISKNEKTDTNPGISPAKDHVDIGGVTLTKRKRRI